MGSNMGRKILAILTIWLLVATLTISLNRLNAPSMASASPEVEEIDTETEYSNGTIGSPHSGLALWYAWINTNDTQIIYLAYQSYKYNPPVVTFLGQHYYAENNTEVFVGNTLTSMEVYKDADGDGVPDVDFAVEKSEIMYYFLVNSSVSFVTTPIEKSLVDGVPHYKWGMRYNTIDGALTFEDGSLAAMITLDYLALSYDFCIQNNVSYLKTNFEIGKILDITTPPHYANVTLEGLSLSLLYGTAVITMKPYVTLVDGEPYNSTTAQTLVKQTESSEIIIGNAKVYEFLFGQNYTLFRDLGEETYESKSAAVANQSVSGNMRTSVEWLLHDLESVLSGVFPRISNMKVTINLDYSVSSFLYRVCYPKWDGYKIKHDPTYLAYLRESIPWINPPTPDISPPIMFVAAAALISLVALTAALIDLGKTRKMLRLFILIRRQI
ncbi:MAG: hypothetical protein QXH37_05255 [Candidatus Bathyarchaeia archaeon]